MEQRVYSSEVPLHNAHIEQFVGSVYKIEPYMRPSHKRCLGIKLGIKLYEYRVGLAMRMRNMRIMRNAEYADAD